MIKIIPALILAISMSYTSSQVFAEEPYIGLGLVKGTYEQDQPGTANDAKANPESYKLTIGSRVSKNLIMEAFFLESKDADTVLLGGNPTPVDIEYEFVVGASINYAVVAGPFTLYAGPNISATKIKATSQDKVLEDLNTLSTQYGPGFGAGIDIRLHKHFSINLHAESYLYDSEKTAIGSGVQLRFHM